MRGLGGFVQRGGGGGIFSSLWKLKIPGSGGGGGGEGGPSEISSTMGAWVF